MIHRVTRGFREQLETEEASIEALEQKLDKVLKTCSVMIESGKTYMSHRRYVIFLLIYHNVRLNSTGLCCLHNNRKIRHNC